MDIKRNTRKRNILYALLQGGYWMQYGTALSFASVIMLNRGYTDSQIGVIIAFGNIPAIILQHALSHFADKSKKVSLAAILIVMYLLEAVAYAGELLTKHAGTMFTISIIMLTVIAASTQGFVNAMSHRLETDEIKVNFGIGRSAGSFMFAIISLVIGHLAEKLNPDVIPTIGFAVCAYLIAVLVIISLSADTTSKAVEKTGTQAKESFFAFFSRYKLFFVVLLGCMGFYLSHSYINNFFYQVVVDVGGNKADLGGILSFAAVTEVLPMFFYSRLEKKFGTKLLLFVSGVFFLIKSLITLIAWNVAGVYVGTFFQMLSFSLFIPASVSFVAQLMNEEDAVRGQSLVTIMINIAFLIASFSGGFIMDNISVKAMVLVGTLTSVAGVTLLGFILRKFDLKKTA